MLPLRQKSIRESAFVAALLLLNILILFKAVTSPVIEFDTQRLVAGIPELSRCLGGIADACKEIPYFAPLQQIPALILHWLGATFDQTLLLLAWLTTAALMIAQMILFRGFFQNQKAVPLFFAATVMAGPVLPYLTSTFSEGLVIALLTGCVIVFARDGAPALTALLFAAVAMSKDTAPLWCLLTALTLWLMTRTTTRRAGKHLIAATAGSCAGLLVITGLNLLRYDSVFNTFHSQPVFMAESVRQILIQLAALIVSPNGGLLWFWPVPLLLVIVAGIGISRAEGDKKFLLPLALIAGGIFVSLSLFYSPFGWVAWGSRLNLPWLFAVALIMVVAGSGFTANNRPALKWAVGALAGQWQLPHAIAALSPAVIMSVFKRTATCPGLINVMADKKMHTVCLNESLWPDSPSVLFTSWTMVPAGAFALLFCITAGAVTILSVCLYLEGAGSSSPQAEGLN